MENDFEKYYKTYFLNEFGKYTNVKIDLNDENKIKGNNKYNYSKQTGYKITFINNKCVGLEEPEIKLKFEKQHNFVGSIRVNMEFEIKNAVYKEYDCGSIVFSL